MYALRGCILALHIFGVVYWIGGLLMIASLLARVPDEVGLPKERFLGVARGLFQTATNVGAATTIGLGILLILMDPAVLRQGWLHAEAAAGRGAPLLSRAVLSADHVPRSSEPVNASRVSRHPRAGEPAVDRDPAARGDETVLA